MGGGDLNSKKGWHPSTLKNQERVWKAEKAAAEEQKRIAELERERQLERDRADLNKLAKSTAGDSGPHDDRLHWMYDKPDKKVQQEEYLLGRAIDKNHDNAGKKEADEIPAVSRRVVGSSMLANADDTQVDLIRKMREDPLLLVKERERAARAALLNNPVQRARLTELLRKEQEKNNESKVKKKSKKKDKDLDNALAEKLQALGGKKGIDLATLLASNDSSSDSSDEKSKKKKKKKKNKRSKDKKKASSDSESESEVDKHSNTKRNKHSSLEKKKRQRSESGDDDKNNRKKRNQLDETRYLTPEYRDSRDNRRPNEDRQSSGNLKVERQTKDRESRDVRETRDDHKTKNGRQERVERQKTDDRQTRDIRHTKDRYARGDRQTRNDRQTRDDQYLEDAHGSREDRESRSDRQSGNTKLSRDNRPFKNDRDNYQTTEYHKRDIEKDSSRDRTTSRLKDVVEGESCRSIKRSGLNEEEKAARLAEMMEAGAEREKQRGRRVAEQLAENDAAEKSSRGPRTHNAVRQLPDSLESRIHSNRHYIQRDQRHMNEHFARR